MLVELVAFSVAFYPMQLVAVDPLLLKGGVKQLTSRNQSNCESTDRHQPHRMGIRFQTNRGCPMLNQPTFFDAFERLNPPVAWTGAEVERLFRLRVQLGWDWAAIAVELGRTESGVKSKFKAVVHSRSCAAPSLPGQRDPIPDSVLAEQARRVVARARDLAGSVFGDPPIGFSALDKRSVA